MALPGLASVPGLGGWDRDPLWGRFYDWSVEHPGPGGLLWRAGLGSDLRLLHAAAEEVGQQPAGSVVLDVPSGGGVALRGLRPGQGVRYVAADISARMLRRTMAAAERRGVADQVEALVADVGALPQADASVDLVVSFTGLHCFPDPLVATRELVRCCDPGACSPAAPSWTTPACASRACVRAGGWPACSARASPATSCAPGCARAASAR